MSLAYLFKIYDMFLLALVKILVIYNMTANSLLNSTKNTAGSDPIFMNN